MSCGNEEFQDAVRRAVPDGHTFKGFPIHFLHRNARRAFATCLRYLHKQTDLPFKMSFLTDISSNGKLFREALFDISFSAVVAAEITHCSFNKGKQLTSTNLFSSVSLRSPFCEEIVCCRGDHVRLAVRVRVFAYPESACAVWIMFACKYRSVL